VNAVMNLRVHKMLGDCRVAIQLVTSRAVPSSIESVSQSVSYMWLPPGVISLQLYIPNVVGI
jgi:hypothetical protein